MGYRPRTGWPISSAIAPRGHGHVRIHLVDLHRALAHLAPCAGVSRRPRKPRMMHGARRVAVNLYLVERKFAYALSAKASRPLFTAQQMKSLVLPAISAWTPAKRRRCRQARTECPQRRWGHSGRRPCDGRSRPSHSACCLLPEGYDPGVLPGRTAVCQDLISSGPPVLTEHLEAVPAGAGCT